VLHFYGHVYNTFHNETTQYASKMKNAYNVGVDIIGFAPVALEEIINTIQNNQGVIVCTDW
jgi:calcineurin-like phosphoesterase family protein